MKQGFSHKRLKADLNYWTLKYEIGNTFKIYYPFEDTFTKIAPKGKTKQKHIVCAKSVFKLLATLILCVTVQWFYYAVMIIHTYLCSLKMWEWLCVFFSKTKSNCF